MAVTGYTVIATTIIKNREPHFKNKPRSVIASDTHVHSWFSLNQLVFLQPHVYRPEMHPALLSV